MCVCFVVRREVHNIRLMLNGVVNKVLLPSARRRRSVSLKVIWAMYLLLF